MNPFIKFGRNTMDTKKDKDRLAITRMVRGAVKEVMDAHPTWFSDEGKTDIHGTSKVGYSVSKRASGNILTYLHSKLNSD